MKKLPSAFLLAATFYLISTAPALAQYPIVFSQFALNPFHFNPSYAANNGFIEANLFYRKQWVGIENAPESGAFNIQAPVGRNVSLGLSAFSNKTVLLNTTGAMATFGYRVRINRFQHFNFGISSGLGMNNFNREAIANSNDPVLINAVQNSQYLIGQVGVNYQLKNLNIGFSLPTLFDAKANTTENFQEVRFNVFDNKFGSVSYTFNIKNVQLTPTVIYRALATYQDQWDVMFMATYRNFIWAGISYRDNYGLTGMIGVRLKGRLRLGYAYEYPTGSINRASTGSHELFVGTRLGNRNREEEIFAQQMRRDSLNQIAKTPEIKNIKDAPVEANTVQPQRDDKPVEKQPEVVPQPVQPEQAQKQEEPMGEVMQKIDQVNNKTAPKGFYLIVGVYAKEENALRNFGNLRNAGHNPQIMFVEEKGYFYIYLFHSIDRIEAVKELEKVRAQNKFYGAWIYAR